MITDELLEQLLIDIQKPGRYINGEWNSCRKDPDQVKVRIALIFPDVYEIGMSYLGQKILYSLLNSHPSIYAERVYVPWVDFEDRLRKSKIPLFSLETRSFLKDFDILGFSLLYELNYTNVLTVLDLAGIPFRSSERKDSHPFVIAGGPAAFNPEPLADFMDLFLIGEGEQALLEIVEMIIDLKERKKSKQVALRTLNGIKGVYVPSMYEPSFPDGSPFVSVKTKKDSSARVIKRIQFPFQKSPFPEDIIVPNIQTVFDRTSIEIARGCPEKCRFCQATNLYFPPRFKDPEFLVKTASGSIRSTGYSTVSLSSLSTADYPDLDHLTGCLMKEFDGQYISLSLSSLRPKGLTKEVIKNIARGKKTGFTLVPEAGTERLRKIINKDMKKVEVINAAANAFKNGWQLIKLYFMVGLPLETRNDLEGIIHMVEEIHAIGKKELKKDPRIHVSISSFIPKPHTPFQWEKMDSESSLIEKHRHIRSKLKRYRSVKFNKPSLKRTILEAVLSRGDRRLNPVILKAWQEGARFDSWDDQFDFSVWEKAFMSERVEYHSYLSDLDLDGCLPWDHIDIGIEKSYLLNEREKAYKEKPTPSCLEIKCSECMGCSWQEVVRKRFPVLKDIPVDEKTWFGRKTKKANLYRVTYEKTGGAKFLSHQDVINLIQRTLRRANVSVVYSQGFHPKMKISFPPALALGMEGFDEKFEFKSFYSFSEKAFLKRMNASSPNGIFFKKHEKREEGAASLMKELKGFRYSVDLSSDLITNALARFSSGEQKKESEDPIIERRLDDLTKSRSYPDLDNITHDKTRNVLCFTIYLSQKKQTRPQEIVEYLFDIKNSAYSIRRDQTLLSD